MILAATTAALPVAAGPAQAAGRQPGDRLVTARAETPALFDDAAGGDADADDPAIWVHPRDRARSLVIGTAKNGGLRVYDLAGREVQAIATPPGGRFNNVDIVTGFRLGKRSTDLAVVTDRGRDQLRFYRIDPATSRLEDVTVADPPLLFSADQAEVAEQATGYGLATRGDLAVVSRRHTTRLGFFRLRASGAKMTYARQETLDLPKSFRLPNGTTWQPCGDPGEDPQVEGMVIDTRANVLYASPGRRRPVADRPADQAEVARRTRRGVRRPVQRGLHPRHRATIPATAAASAPTSRASRSTRTTCWSPARATAGSSCTTAAPTAR